MVGHDWASMAARKILADCLDRRGIKHQFEATDEDVIMGEILPAWASIIRLAALDQLQRMDGEEGF